MPIDPDDMMLHQEVGIKRPDQPEKKIGFLYNPKAPEFEPLMPRPFGTFRQAIPIPRSDFIPEQEATVIVKNAGDDVDTTLDDLYDQSDLFRVPAYARIRDLESGEDVARIDGIVMNDGEVGDEEGEVRISTYDHSLFEEELPKLRVRDVFSSETEQASLQGEDPSVLVVFGKTRKLPLQRVTFEQEQHIGEWEAPLES